LSDSSSSDLPSSARRSESRARYLADGGVEVAKGLIAQAAAQSAKQGLDVFLGFLAFVSVNLAVLNMLPIPVLDGGQFLFLLAEGIFRRPLSLRLREQLTMVGLVLIVLLMVLAFSNDIRRLIGG